MTTHSFPSLDTLLQECVPAAAEGIVLCAFHKGEEVLHLRHGTTYPYYDWASLTKVVFTVTRLMQLFDEKLFSFDDPLKDHCSWYPHESVTIGKLLTHTSGLPAWKDFGEMLDESYLRHKKWIQMLEITRESTPAPTGKAVYSDLGFMLLGGLIEESTGDNLPRLWKELASQLGLKSTWFHPENSPVYRVTDYAPTEECPLRRKKIQGEVNDENTWYAGGVSTHAGLFGPVDDLNRWALGLRACYYGGKWVTTPETLHTFAKRAIPEEVGDWASGFMLPTKGKASCGEYFSLRSIGHLGFTGPSFWFDPDADFLVTILTNRTYPSRENKRFIEMRPLIHNALYRHFITGEQK